MKVFSPVGACLVQLDHRLLGEPLGQVAGLAMVAEAMMNCGWPVAPADALEPQHVRDGCEDAAIGVQLVITTYLRFWKRFTHLVWRQDP
jgi:hypothetical protein